MKPFLSTLLAAAGLLATASCMVGPDYRAPEADVAEAWSGPDDAPGRRSGDPSPRWWSELGDPTLDQLIDAACRSNLSLQEAGVRVLEARARLNRSIGDLFPQQQGIGGQVAHARQSGALTPPGVAADSTTSQALFSASWEIDFWGRYRRAIEADRAAFLGSVAAYDDARVTLIADVASSYVRLRTLEERLRVARQNVEAQRESLRIVSVQFKSGATGERDVRQATTQLAQTQAQIPKFEESLRQTRHALAVLLGETPDRIEARLTSPGRIPLAPEGIATGIPRDLLRRRPDVRAAELAAASASALIGVARADLYPAFSLSGTFGFASTRAGGHSLTDLADWPNRAYGLTGGFFMPLFNYGRLTNQVRVQDARFQAAALRYRNAVLNAQREVEDGLATFQCRRQAAALLAQAVEAARRSTALATSQYQGGQTDYTTVILAEQTQLDVEDALAEAQGGVAQGIIAVYRALGGGWQTRQERDVVSDDIKAEMARRTNWGRLLEPSEHLPETPGAENGGTNP